MCTSRAYHVLLFLLKIILHISLLSLPLHPHVGGEKENTCESSKSKITDSDVVTYQKLIHNGHDSKAEAEEIIEESAKTDNSYFIEVSYEKDEALDE